VEGKSGVKEDLRPLYRCGHILFHRRKRTEGRNTAREEGRGPMEVY